MAEKALSMTKMRAQLERAKSAVINMREDAERAVEMGTNTLLTTAGGAIGGVLAAKMPTIPGTDIDSCLAIGTVACGLALVGAGGKMGHQLNALGSGLLAVEAYKATEKALSSYELEGDSKNWGIASPLILIANVTTQMEPQS